MISSQERHFLSPIKRKLKDVIGLSKVKNALCKKVIVPIIRKKLHGDSGIKHPVCILLHGPSDCGKSLLMYAVETETETKINILTSNEVKLIRSGEGRRIFNDLFQRAAKHDTSSIIFIENFGALCRKRRHAFDVMDCLLEEMNRASDLADVYVVISSNNPRIKLDSFVRPGFISSALYVDLPHPKAVIKIVFEPSLKRMGFEFAFDRELVEFYSQCRYYSFQDWVRFINIAMSHNTNGNWRTISREHFIFGLNKIRPSTSPEVVRKFRKRQAGYKKILKNAARIKSDVLAKSFSTF